MNFIRKNRSAQLKSAAVINRAALPMFQLTLPIIGETFFRTLVASADTLMLSSYKDSAVAAVGMMGQYIFFTQLPVQALFLHSISVRAGQKRLNV